MSWLGSVRSRLGLNPVTNSRGVARERLSIILAHERGNVLLEGTDLQRLQEEVLNCVKDNVSQPEVTMSLENIEEIRDAFDGSGGRIKKGRRRRVTLAASELSNKDVP